MAAWVLSTLLSKSDKGRGKGIPVIKNKLISLYMMCHLGAYAQWKEGSLVKKGIGLSDRRGRKVEPFMQGGTWK
jgi:hypothetical protein